MDTKQNVFIGGAWPYANSSLHLGHAAALLSGDVLARYHRLNGDNVLYVSGSDCFGTPITLSALKAGVTPKEIADRYHREFVATFDRLGFSYDLYTRTDTPEHKKVVQGLFLDLLEKGLIYTKSAPALYSPYLGRYLPDRHIVGICPSCKSAARGDQCESCGTPFEAHELLEPRINPVLLEGKVLSDSERELVVRDSEQFYLRLSELEVKIVDWSKGSSKNWRANARAFTESFLAGGLIDRAITRDTDYGIPVPVAGYDDKRIYVWFEAVAGYLSASVAHSERSGLPESWRKWWQDSNSLHYYAHGKDNIPFHTVLWPAILIGSGDLKLPDVIVSSEYLQQNGAKFSKSRGGSLALDTYLDEFDAEALRYFLIANGPEASDSNFSREEFAERVNGELIGTFGNFVHRVLSIAYKHFPTGLHRAEKADGDTEELLEAARATFERVSNLLRSTKLRAALKEVIELAARGNRFATKKEPWKKVKDPATRAEAEADLATLVHVIHALGRLIAPFLPNAAEQIGVILDLDRKSERWEYPWERPFLLVAHAPTPLVRKIEEVTSGELTTC
jgi:methionyl-tRNA synthetase